MSGQNRELSLLVRAAGVVVVAAILLELGARGVDRVRGKPFDSAERRAVIEEICRSLSVPRTPLPSTGSGGADELLQPYVAWQDADLEARFAGDARSAPSPEAKSAFDVFVLGGSDAAVLGRAGSTALAASLRRDPSLRDREIRIHPYALEGFKEPQPLMTLVFLLSLGRAPDLVVEIDGLDDARLGWSNARAGTHPLHPSVEHWAKTSGGARSDWELAERFHETHVRREAARGLGLSILRSGLWRSALLEPFAARKLEDLRDGVVASEARVAEYLATRPRESELDGPRFPKDDAGIADTIARGWEEASISLQALCSCRGIRFVHVLEPGLEPGLEEGSSEAIAQVYPRLRAAAIRLTGRGIHCLDASEGFRGSDLRDAQGRPTARGCEVLADAVLEALLRSAPR